jgi:hypothetical protein
MLIRTPERSFAVPEGFPAYACEFKDWYGWVYCIQILESNRFKVGATAGGLGQLVQRIKHFKRICKTQCATLFVSSSQDPMGLERIIKREFPRRERDDMWPCYMLRKTNEVYILGYEDYARLYQIASPTAPTERYQLNETKYKTVVTHHIA